VDIRLLGLVSAHRSRSCRVPAGSGAGTPPTDYRPPSTQRRRRESYLAGGPKIRSKRPVLGALPVG